MAATADQKHDLTLRKIPLSKLIYRAAFETDVEPTVIRDQLNRRLKVSHARRSQIENVLKSEPTPIRRAHLDTINQFFTDLLKETVRVEAEYESEPIGIFAGNTKLQLAHKNILV